MAHLAHDGRRLADIRRQARAWDLVLTGQADPRVRVLQEPTGPARDPAVQAPILD